MSRRRWRRTRRCCTTTSLPRASTPSRPSPRTSRRWFASPRAMSRPASAKPKSSIERRYTTKPVHQGYIEPHACVVSVAPDGQTTIWSSSQGQFMVRGYTARIVGADIANIRAIPAEIGGGFGGKTIVYLEPVAYMLSKKSGPAGQDRDEPRGGIPGDRADLGRRRRSQARRQEGRQHRRRQGRAQIPVGRVSGLAGPAGLHLRLCGRTTCRMPSRSATTFCAIAPKLPPIARRARRSARSRSKAAWTSWRASSRSTRCELREINGAKDGTKAAHGPTWTNIGYRKTLEAAKAHPQSQDAARPQPGPRHRLRLLAQCRR